MSALEKHKQTGRTTRMMAEALRLAGEGRAVYVVVATCAEADSLTAKYPRSSGIKFEGAESFPELDGHTMNIRRAHPNCVVLVDHWVIERRYAAMLEMLHRFDQPEASK